MRFALAFVGAALAACLALAQEPTPLPTLPPPKRIVLDPCFPLPKGPELRESLLKFSAERDAFGQTYEAAARDFEQGLGSDTSGMTALRLRVKQLLTRLGEQKAIPPSTAEPPLADPPGTPKTAQPKAAQPKAFPLVAPKAADQPREAVPQPVDALALAQALFRAGNYDAALRAFRLVELKGAKSEQRAPVLYLTASCLRNLGKTDEAITLYREVAAVKGDESVAQCAVWQLGVLRWHKETQDRLGALRQRRSSLEATP